MIIIIINSPWMVRALFAAVAMAGAIVTLFRKYSYAGPVMVIGGSSGVLWANVAAGVSWAWWILPAALIALGFLRAGLMRFGWRRD